MNRDGPHSVTVAIAVELLVVIIIFMAAAIVTNVHGILVFP